MLDQLWHSWQHHFWLSLASIGAGLVVLAPCLLVPSWRRRILRSDIDIEGVGLITMVVVIAAIGFYNYFAGR